MVLSPSMPLRCIQVSQAEVIQTIKLENLLVRKADRPALNLDSSAGHRLIELLRPGIPIDQAATQDRIAQVLASFPVQCQTNNVVIDATIKPIPELEFWSSGKVRDKRRIYDIAVYGCLEEIPKECDYCLCDNGGFDFNLVALTGFLANCKDAINRDSAAGAAYDPALKIR